MIKQSQINKQVDWDTRPCLEVDGVKHKPFGEGSGARICEDYGVPNLFQMPIVPELSACGDSGRPLVLEDPAGGGPSIQRRN